MKRPCRIRWAPRTTCSSTPHACLVGSTRVGCTWPSNACQHFCSWSGGRQLVAMTTFPQDPKCFVVRRWTTSLINVVAEVESNAVFPICCRHTPILLQVLQVPELVQGLSCPAKARHICILAFLEELCLQSLSFLWLFCIARRQLK